MKQKQNTVVQWSMIALAGIFSVAGLLLFWRYDFAEAQIPVAQASGKLTQN
ncbi:MAG: hypothetical protein LBO09_07650 [Candidatus Peribacteria bacterium]|jgi:hypothetical protein|nr:hypothetical protein [Candidatus Peribacteria bacterium]